MRGTEVSPGSRSAARTYRGRPGTWEVLLSPPNVRDGNPVNKPRPRVDTRRHEERTASHRWYRQAKATKCGGMDCKTSELSIVLMKPGNHPKGPGGGKGEAGPWDSLEGTMPRTPSLENVSTKLQRIAELARKAPEMAFTALAHHVDMEWLRVAHRHTRKDGAVGVDGQTAVMFGENLEGNLQGLLDRFKSGTYRAPPVRRVHIPKGDGRTRPIGIPAFEDKVLQRAVVMTLEAIYEQDFLDCSYGFRRGRSAHQALEMLSGRLMRMGGAWVLEVDIQSYFDNINHGHLRAFLDQRVRDGVIRRAIDKWLSAGVLEGGELVHPDDGTPQGGVISPLLANIYLHEVLDRWFEHDVRPRLEGQAFLVRYADDCAPRRRGKETARSNGCSLAAREMRAGPSSPGCRTRAQTTGCCSDPMVGVVSETEKAGPTRQVCAVKTNASEPSTTCRKRRNVHRNRAPVVGSGQARGEPADCSSGDRHEDGVSTAQALVRNVGTFCLDAKRELQVVDP